MRYGAWFTGKLAVSGAVMFGLLAALNTYWPAPQAIRISRGARLGYDLMYTLLAGLWFLLCCGVFYLCVLDQRYRCRVCARRLRMPVETGSWSRLLTIGRPGIEYICPYGHGTLRESELQISGLEDAEWTPHADLWEELCATSSKETGPPR